MKKTYIGVDPGSSTGGIAWLTDTDGKIELHAQALAKITEMDLSNLYSEIVFESDTVFCVCERVWAIPSFAVKNEAGETEQVKSGGAVASFSFGENYGVIRMGMVCHGIPFALITPPIWMKFYSMKKEKSESKTEWKRRLRQRGESLFPAFKFTNPVSDAILIANYCYQIKK